MAKEKILVNGKDYSKRIAEAVEFFWNTKQRQLKASGNSSNRGAVVGGKQMDGFVGLIKQTAIEAGIPDITKIPSDKVEQLLSFYESRDVRMLNTKINQYFAKA